MHKSTLFLIMVLFTLISLLNGCDLFLEGVDTPDNLIIELRTESSLTITWNSVENASGYRLYRSNNENGQYDLIGANIKNTSYVDSGLISSTTYWYKVSAYKTKKVASKFEITDYSELVESKTSNPVSGITLRAVEIPEGLVIEERTMSSLTVSWNSVINADGYRVYRSISSTASYTKISEDITETTYTDTGLEQSTTYWYKIAAYNEKGESELSEPISGTTLGPLDSPTDIIVENEGARSLTISWYGVEGAEGYRVYRSMSETGSYTKINGDVTETTYTDTGLSPLTTYWYKLSSFNSERGESSKSDPVSGTTLDLTIPTPPTNVSVTSTTSNSITLIWDVVADADGYVVYRFIDGELTNISGNISSNTYTDAGLETGTTYWYKIASYNSKGESEKSDFIDVTTLN